MTWFWIGVLAPPIFACAWGILEGLFPVLNKMRPPEWRARTMFFADWLSVSAGCLVVLQVGLPVWAVSRGWSSFMAAIRALTVSQFKAGLGVSLLIGIVIWWWNRRQRRRNPGGSGVGYKIAAVYERMRGGWRSQHEGGPPAADGHPAAHPRQATSR
jgi:hypothetical protein